MAVAKYKIVRKCPVCGEEFFARTLESWYCSPKCSKVAWKRKHDEEKRQLELDKIVSNMPKSKEYISITEAYAMFGASRLTIYRLIYMKKISFIEPEKGIRLVCWKSHATLTLLATQDLPTFGYNMIDPLKSWCWGAILFYPFKISRFS